MQISTSLRVLLEQTDGVEETEELMENDLLMGHVSILCENLKEVEEYMRSEVGLKLLKEFGFREENIEGVLDVIVEVTEEYNEKMEN